MTTMCLTNVWNRYEMRLKLIEIPIGNAMARHSKVSCSALFLNERPLHSEAVVQVDQGSTIKLAMQRGARKRGQFVSDCCCHNGTPLVSSENLAGTSCVRRKRKRKPN